MKKTVSFLLALIMVCCMAVPAFAAENQTLVTLTIDESMESYEVTIPPTITLDAVAFATDGGGKTALNVTINNLSAVWSTKFYIYVTSKNGFNLVNTEDPSKVIPYGCYCPSCKIITKATAGEAYQFNWYYISDILDKGLPLNTTSSSGDELLGGYLYRDGSDTYPGGGTYTDTLTFTFEFSN
jgi:hypothetical protein